MSDYDLVVIGSGPGGYVAAIRAAQLGLKTACIEKGALGGTCLNVGCIPSKSLLQSTEILHTLQHTAATHGIKASSFTVDFSQMMQRKKGIVTDFCQGIAFLFKKNKISHIQGTARLLSGTEIEVSGPTPQRITAKNILLATGSVPIELPTLKFDEKRIVSSTGALALEAVPKRLAIIGAGVIGVELGSVYARLGSKVTFIEFADRICPTFDKEISSNFQKILEKQGMQFHLNTSVEGAILNSSSITLTTKPHLDIEADVLLVCVGRKPYTENLNLEAAGIKTDAKGRILIDSTFRTSCPTIYAIGDVVDGPMLAHKASEEGIILAEYLAGKKEQLSYPLIPSVVYTDPEVASTGFTEEQLKEKKIRYKVGKFAFKTNSRAKCAGTLDGFVKVLARDDSTKQLLGVHILGSHASELIAPAVIALSQKLSTHDLAKLPFAHPTLSEAIKEACLAASGSAIHA